MTRTKPKGIFAACMLAALASLAGVAQAKARPQIMGISLEMSREAAQARLKAIGSLEKEDRKRQEVWAIKDPRIRLGFCQTDQPSTTARRSSLSRSSMVSIRSSLRSRWTS